MPNYIALIGLYIASDSLKQAKELLQRIPQDNLDYTYSIKIYIIKSISQKEIIKKHLQI